MRQLMCRPEQRHARQGQRSRLCPLLLSLLFVQIQLIDCLAHIHHTFILKPQGLI